LQNILEVLVILIKVAVLRSSDGSHDCVHSLGEGTVLVMLGHITGLTGHVQLAALGLINFVFVEGLGQSVQLLSEIIFLSALPVMAVLVTIVLSMQALGSF